MPGPVSYCKCNMLCSGLTIDHVVPKKFLKDNINDEKVLRDSVRDQHNLIRCCSTINIKKSAYLLGENDKSTYSDFHNGYLSRISLFMVSKYDLTVDPELLRAWKIMNIKHDPLQFELVRNDMISLQQGDINSYIDQYPATLFTLD